MSDELAIFLIGVLLGGIMVMLMLILSGTTYTDGYKHGQIDYANDKVEYCLIKNEQNENIWDKCVGK